MIKHVNDREMRERLSYVTTEVTEAAVDGLSRATLYLLRES